MHLYFCYYPEAELVALSGLNRLPTCRTRVWVESIGVVVVEATTLIGPVPPSAISQYRNAQCEDISSSDVLALEDRTFAETCAHLFRKQHLAFKSVMITMYYSPQLSQNSPTSLSSDYELRSTHSRQVRRYRSNVRAYTCIGLLFLSD